MASGYAIGRGEPALVLLHTTAGLGTAVSGLATARVNRAPLVVVVGQQDRRHLAFEPFLAGRLAGLGGRLPGVRRAARAGPGRSGRDRTRLPRGRHETRPRARDRPHGRLGRSGGRGARAGSRLRPGASRVGGRAGSRRRARGLPRRRPLAGARRRRRCGRSREVGGARRPRRAPCRTRLPGAFRGARRVPPGSPALRGRARRRPAAAPADARAARRRARRRRARVPSDRLRRGSAHRARDPHRVRRRRS